MCIIKNPAALAAVELSPLWDLIIRERKHTNINKVVGLSWDWVGGKNFFMCFFGVISYGGEKTHKQNPHQIPGQSPEDFTCFFLYVFLSKLCFLSALRSCMPVLLGHQPEG